MKKKYTLPNGKLMSMKMIQRMVGADDKRYGATYNFLKKKGILKKGKKSIEQLSLFHYYLTHDWEKQKRKPYTRKKKEKKQESKIDYLKKVLFGQNYIRENYGTGRTDIDLLTPRYIKERIESILVRGLKSSSEPILYMRLLTDEVLANIIYNRFGEKKGQIFGEEDLMSLLYGDTKNMDSDYLSTSATSLKDLIFEYSEKLKTES